MSNWNTRHSIAHWGKIRDRVGPKGERTFIRRDGGKIKRYRIAWVSSVEDIALRKARP